MMRETTNPENHVNPRDLLLTAMLFLALGACGRNATDAGSAETAAPAADSASTEPGGPTALPRSPSPDGARVYFLTPADGATVASPVRVEFGVDAMDIVPAGTDAPASGHHHVIIDSDLPPFDAPIPADANHVHFGDGSTATELALAPGEHTLRLLLGDHLHIPHDPPVYSETIRITVE